MPRSVLDRAARLVGELAEIDFVSMGRRAKHVNVRARAEDAWLEAGDDYDTDFGMLETQSHDGVRQFDVNAQIVGIELQLVTRRERLVFPDVHFKRRHRAVNVQLPVTTLGGRGLKVDHFFLKSFFKIFPAAFFGRLVMNSTDLGTL